MPSTTIASFERLTGIDLGFVPVDRGPGAGRASSELNARGFTAGGTIHVPHETGPLDRADNEALVAHELAHVAQQRAYGASAAETDTHGDDWELQASAIERAFRGEEVEPEEWEAAIGPIAEAPFLSWTPDDGFVSEAPAPSGGSGFQRKPQTSEDAPPESQSWLRATPGGRAGQLEDGQVHLAFPEVTSLEPEPDDESDDDSDDEGNRSISAQDLEAIVEQVRESFAVQHLNFNDPILLDGLALNLYDRMRRMLRSELIVDRERSGVLTEFH